MARAREAMQKQQLGCAGWSRFAIEELETVDVGAAISDRRHPLSLSLSLFLSLSLEKLLYLTGSLLLGREFQLLDTLARRPREIIVGAKPCSEKKRPGPSPS
jgi:hypothetical protein